MTGSVWDESRPSRGHPSGGDEWLATGAAGKSPCWGGTLGSSVEGDLQSPSAEGPRPLGDGRPCEASGTWTVQHRPTGHTLGRHCPAKAPRLPTRNRELTSPLCQPGKLWVPRHTTVRLRKNRGIEYKRAAQKTEKKRERQRQSSAGEGWRTTPNGEGQGRVK